MSPEELLSTVDLDSTEAFKQMDIYSMALVLWEIISRCEVAGKYSIMILAAFHQQAHFSWQITRNIASDT